MEPPPVQYATTSDGISIAWSEYGHGPALLYCPTAPFSHVQERYLVYGGYYEAFYRLFRVVTFDARGTGMSEREVARVSAETLLVDAEAVIEAAKLDHFVVLADGGSLLTLSTGLRLAITYPERVTHVVLESPYQNMREVADTPFGRTGSALAELDWAVFTQTLVRVLLGWDAAASDMIEPLARAVRGWVDPSVGLRYVREMEVIDVGELLPQVRQPTLVIRNDLFFVPARCCQRVAARIPGAQFRQYSDPTYVQELELARAFVDQTSPELPKDAPAVPAPHSSTASLMARPGLPSGTGATMRVPSGSVHTFATGRYTVVRQLGEGGQKIVYLVHDEALDRQCALSMIKSDVLDADDLMRLRREAQAMARLGAHSNIVTVHDFGEEDGKPYLVCEYVPGGDLRRELRNAGGSLRLERALAIAMDIARALAVAHARGVIHRDLKPANVWLCNDGSAKLGDFGLAFSLDRSRLTIAGTVMGTAAYMSPEQALAQPVTESSDLYSLGALLYEMGCGRPPFTDENATALIAQHINAQPVAPSEYNQDLPPALGALILRLLAKTPEKRPESATEVLAALEAIAEAHKADAREEAPAVRPPGGTEQEIRFCSARDGVRLAYATVGAGYPLVKAANWLSHLEFDWQSPVWRHLYQALAAHHQLIRYDERGTGLSDREVEHMSIEDWASDLETVVDTTGLDRFALLGISQGGPVAIAYAVRHPDRVSHLILYGSFARFPSRSTAENQALLALMRAGWGREASEYRQVFTSMFIPDATAEQMRWFNELERRSASPETAARILEVITSIDVSELAARVTVPTLILHCDDDQAVPFPGGRELASLVPGARFVPLEGGNHYFLEHDPARQVFLRELNAFLGD